MLGWLRSIFKKVSPSQVLVIGFAAIILLGGLLLKLPISVRTGHIRFIDALFTSTSAVCVTGLVTVDTGTTYTTFGQLIVISLIQIGGLGFMTMSTIIAVLLGKKIGLRERLLIQESLNQSSLSGMVKLVRQVILVTLTLEGIGGILLSIRLAHYLPLGQAVYFGFFHAISSFCNAGFDLFGMVYRPFTSITQFVSDAWITLVIAFLIILGGIGFPVIFELIRHKKGKRLSTHTRLALIVTAALLLIGTVAIYLLELNNPATLKSLNEPTKWLASFFQSVTPRTAGYNSLDYNKMREATIFISIILMFIGASPSSTGGGIKTVTFGVLMATVWATIRGREDAELYERRLPKTLVYKAVSLTVFALALIGFVSILISITDHFGFLRILFEVTSGFGTVGLTTGITPYLSNFARILLILTMFAGRVGLLTIAVSLAQRLQPGNIRYTEENVMIG
ncbi:MAG TPA: TrkH family potassium uptake protein [Bacillota bacterium]|nr:TrkH family potassium uptake protein [Bacillota bacterium]